MWFDEWVIRPGDDIYLAIERGLGAARVQVLCLSPAALGSDWVAQERSTVLVRDPTNAARHFIPLVLADCELPDTLRRYKYVDFREEAEAAFKELLTACRVATEEVPEALPPKPAETASPTGIESLVGTKRAEQPPASQPKPKEKKPQPGKPPEQAEPLAVLERTLTGHKGCVRSVAISPDGKWAASGADDKTVKIWDLETGECRATLEGHTGGVNSIAITSDEKRILSGSKDKSVRVWDTGSGREWAKLDGHLAEVWSVAALQNDARALSGGWDNTFRLWDLASRSCLKTIQCGTDTVEEQIFGSAVNRVGNQALSGHRNGRIRLWNLETGECLATLTGHSDIVDSIQITRDGRFAVSGSDDKTVKVWDLEAGLASGRWKAIKAAWIRSPSPPTAP